MQGKKLLLIVTGSISAYKSCILARALIDHGCQVKVIMSESATKFITPLTFESITGEKVTISIFDIAMDHIKYARWADIILVAPATANRIASIANGDASDLIGATLLATHAPCWFVPAMNVEMWNNPSLQSNVSKINQLGWRQLGPESGELACGEVGMGRMTEPDAIILELEDFYNQVNYKNSRIVITAGPTYQPIDEIRFIGNRSSGKMGYALASVAHDAEAQVTLISGPTSLSPPYGVDLVQVQTAEEMYEATFQFVSKANYFIGCAAVSDYSPQVVLDGKLSKNKLGNTFTLTLTQTKDILSEVAHMYPDLFSVGFCAQCEDLENQALRKLREKKLKMIVANKVGRDAPEQCGIGGDFNEVTVFWQGGSSHFPKQSKRSLSRKLLELVYEVSHG